MLHPWIPTLSPSNSSDLKWKKTSNTCSRWNALMSTLLLLETTEVFEPLMVYWFASDITKLSILHAHAQETYHLPEHPHIIRTIYTTIFLPPPPNIYGPDTLPIAPPINIPNALPIDHTPIDTILWTIFTREMPPTPILCDDHRPHPPIKLTASAKLEGLILQAKTTLIVTSFKSML